MNPLRRLSCAAVLLGSAGLAAAAPNAPRDGVEYRTLPQAVPADAGAKVEVIEFFAYYCPHCHAFEPALSAWVSKQGDNIVFKRVHVPQGPSVAPQQRLFYTLDAMGLLARYHDKVFTAMHAERQRLATDEQVFDWAERSGIDRARFVETWRSFGVQARLRRAAEMMQAYQVPHWPMVAIDGRFLTSLALASEGERGARTEAQLQHAALQVMDHLVAKAKADKK